MSTRPFAPLIAWWRRQPWRPTRPATSSARPLATRRRRRLTRLGVGLALTVVLIVQLNGPLGAWVADQLRAVLGPSATAQVEAWYLSAKDKLTQVRYHLPGQSVTAPYQVTPTTTLAPGVTPSPTAAPAIAPMPLTPIAPTIVPTLAGEGVWSPVATLFNTPGTPPIIVKTFIRPDAARPYAIVTMLQFDQRFTQLHMVAGTKEPGGPLGKSGPGVIPSADLARQQLLAAFNGGFKYSDGHYGMMVNNVVYVPPVAGQATIAITRTGQAFIAAWGADPRLTLATHLLVAWRQNAALLIDHGVLNPLTSDGGAWGGTVLNSAYTWRSGIGITSQGTLISASGNALSAATLGKALLAAGAVMAMQTDINPYWVRAFTFQRDKNGVLQATKLNPGMQGDSNPYMRGDDRDFFYVTRILSSQP